MTAVDNEKTRLEYLKDIIDSYEEIASLRMRKVKKSVLISRDFLDGVKQVYAILTYNYKRTHTRGSSADMRPTNGKTVSVLLSSNTGLYGDIITKTFNTFHQHIRSVDTDIVIVGRIGMQMYDSTDVGKPFRYFQLSDGYPDASEVTKVFDHISQYSNVIVFHGQFKDILLQDPFAEVISGDTTSVEFSSGVDTTARYIFEPSLEKLLEYFEQEILRTLFEQSVYESNLSKYASRMINLDRASQKIAEEIEKEKIRIQKVKHRILNTKQLTTLTSVAGRGF